MTRSKQIFLSIAFQGLAEAVNKILPFVVLHFVLLRIGAAGYGYADFSFRIVDLLLPFVVFGYLHVGVIELGSAADDHIENEKIVSEVLCLKIFHALIMMAVLWGLVTLIPSYRSYAPIALPLGFLILTTAFDMSWVHIGQRKMISSAMITIGAKLVSLVAILVLVKDESDILLFSLIFFGANGLISVGTFAYTAKRLKLRMPTLQNLKKRFVVSLPYSLLALWTYLLARYDLYIVESQFDAETYGLYSGAKRIVISLGALVASLQLVFLAEVVNSKSREDLTSIVNLAVWAGMLVVLPISVGAWTVDNDLMAFVLTEGFRSAGTQFSILTLGILFQMLITTYASQVLFAERKISTLNYFHMVVIASGIGLSYRFSRIFGVEGAAAANTLVLFFGAILAMALASKYLDKQNISEFFSLVLASVIMALGILIVQSLGINSFVIKIIVGAAIYVAAVLVLNRMKFMRIYSKLTGRD